MSLFDDAKMYARFAWGLRGYLRDPITLADAEVFFTTALNDVDQQTFDFRVQDSGGIANGGDNTSQDATVTVNITAVNDEPTADDQTVTAIEDVETSITLTGDDGDADEVQTLSYILVKIGRAAWRARA